MNDQKMIQMSKSHLAKVIEGLRHGPGLSISQSISILLHFSLFHLINIVGVVYFKFFKILKAQTFFQ